MNAAVPGANEPTRELSRAFEIAARVGGLPEHLREVALQSAVGTDQILEHAVRSLLRGRQLPTGPTAAPVPPPLAKPDFGRYLLCERLGEGSMGVVHRAVHIDTGRSVAIKLLHGGSASEALLRRFHSEVAMLARLNHPGIVNVLDAGHAQVGDRREPFLVMELVEGPGLLEGAEKLGLDLRARVRLILDLCDATAHAHRRGVIHRDLKPENVRLDLDATPPRARILDFGVATPMSAIRHPSASVVGTFGYMAPEQLDGEIDLRGDVFGLGTIAYELLTGNQAVPARGLSVAAALELTRTHTPVQADRLAVGIDADLAAVLAKALARDPDQRYSGADQFGADLQRWLEHRPVQARERTAFYLTRRFVARHRMLTGVATVILIAIASSVAIAILGSNSARAANQDLRILVGGTLEELRRIADHGGRPQVLPADLTETVDRMVARAPTDPIALRIQADVLHLQSDLARLDGRLDEALAQRRNLLRVADQLVAQEASLSNMRLKALAHVLVGDILKEETLGTPSTELAEHYLAAHRLFAAVRDGDPGSRQARDDFGHSCLRLAHLEERRGRGEDAWGWITVAEPVVLGLANDHPDHPFTHGLFREYLGTNAFLLEHCNNVPASPELTGQILEHVRRACQLDPQSVALMQLHLSAARGHATMLRSLGDRAGAERHILEAEQVAEQLIQRDPTSGENRDEIFMLRADQAEFALDEPDVSEALRFLYAAERELLELSDMRELPHVGDRLRRFCSIVSRCLAMLEQLGDEDRTTALLVARLVQSGAPLLAASRPEDRELAIANLWLTAVAGSKSDASRAQAGIEQARTEGWFDDRLWLAEIQLLERLGELPRALNLLGAPPTPMSEPIEAAARHTRERLQPR